MAVRIRLTIIRVAAISTLLGCALIAPVGCAAGESPAAAARAAVPSPPSAFLDAARPEARVSVDASRINSDVSGMLIPVISVRNPDRIAVQIHVSLEIRTADGVRTTRLGSFSLFPADNPGTFTVPFARARLLAAAAGQPAPETCVLVFRLEPIVADEPLREVRLEIGALRWIS